MAGAPKSGVATGTGTAAAARIKDGGGNISFFADQLDVVGSRAVSCDPVCGNCFDWG
jgi:hypothetical protein